jgi:predicted nucleic acid-binding protein
VKCFLDTSVLIAAFLESDTHHADCRALLLQVCPETAACGAHSLAEFYSVLTRLPVPLRMRAEQVWLLLEDVHERVTPVALTSSEHFRELKRIAEMGIQGGRVYDALLIACARKQGAERIYTLNLRHFRSLAPDLADRIVTP